MNNAAITPVSGQRWVSKNEPELGLGLLLRVARGKVEMLFPAANEQRVYTWASAPLQRVEFGAGDVIKSHEGKAGAVVSVEDRDGLLVYTLDSGEEVIETGLADTVSFSKPDRKLLSGIVDHPRAFDLRFNAGKRFADLKRRQLVGMVGARIDLIPHQFAVALDAASRLHPRLLLADEVGLGKTIEAGLIVQRLHLTGRANRVLIVVPEPLMNQWFVELLRRFNLLFSLFDEERCQSIEANDAGVNPFLDSQLVICSPELLTTKPERAEQALAAGWDMLVVDEAHHLEWSVDEVSPAYQVVESLAAAVPGLLLLTATPEQLGGTDGHFARLRLLDPERYDSLEHFGEQSAHYREVAEFVDRLLAGEAITAADRQLVEGKSSRASDLCDRVEAGEAGASDALVAELLDSFGTGRDMFRNTRAALGGFPERQAHLIDLGDVADPFSATIEWMVQRLAEDPERKLLVIGKTVSLAERVIDAVAARIQVKSAAFHEEMTLLQRDRAAAWFADDEGAQLLCCSEIGSEGRNFQFAHDLVLIDLPENPELLEQRIGRLDRIGQDDTIHIHVPFSSGSEEEVLAHWYHEGMGAFEHCVHGASEIAAEVAPLLDEALQFGTPESLKALVEATAAVRARVGEKLESGQDRLLELKSRPGIAVNALLDQVADIDSDLRVEKMALRLFEQFGVAVEEVGTRTYSLKPDHITTDALPGLPEDGLTMTFERRRALSHEDMAFGSVDHPLVRGAVELMANEGVGAAAFGMWENAAGEGLFLEAVWVVDCSAPAHLEVGRFLPPTPVKFAVDHTAREVLDRDVLDGISLRGGDPAPLLAIEKVKTQLIPNMIERTRAAAEAELAAITATATSDARTAYEAELARMRDLAEINHSVPQSEVDALAAREEEVVDAIANATVRLDAVRLIRRVTPRVRTR
ncbi:SNF2-related protein [Sulfuriroseicoccus oceanibius]|uniref:DEAD/DEAH box helicase family protein n=1 Tax=Sulfuriroseicoccus oceanibius TaxID=2707525 RepID=A0A6B3LD65_9BACT|nr:SNF2-related protein [Sulfuriroseicoccus oceanibius]QQL45091.1 DEAD/DEAH box helicase family protein [Sulfuriroseicoccus oceanibius]